MLILILVVLLVIGIVTLCACQPAEEDFSWVKIPEKIIQDMHFSGLVECNFYPIELLTDAPYKVVFSVDEFQHHTHKSYENYLFVDNFGLGNTIQNEKWGQIGECDITLYFMDDAEYVVGYAILKLYVTNVDIQHGGNIVMEGEVNGQSTSYEFYYGQIIKSVKFTNGAIPFEQAQKTVDNLLK